MGVSNNASLDSFLSGHTHMVVLQGAVVGVTPYHHFSFIDCSIANGWLLFNPFQYQCLKQDWIID